MKKAVLAGAVLAAAAIGGGSYYVVQQKSTSAILKYIPAETLFYVGDMQPMSWQDMASMRHTLMPGANLDLQKEEATAWLDTLTGHSEGTLPGVRLMASLYLNYLQVLSQPDAKPENVGLSDRVDMAMYTAGALPVLRMRLGNEAAFDQFMARVMKQAKVSPEQLTLEQLSYQRFALNADQNKPIGLAIAKKDGYAIFTLDPGKLLPPEQGLKLAFGLTAPAQSLAQSGMLQRMVKEQGLLPIMLGFVNHQALMQVLTRADNPVSLWLDRLSDGEWNQQVSDLRSAGCQQDLDGMAALWPRTLFGYTRIQDSQQGMQLESLIRVESKDQATLGELQKLRGVLPTLSGHDGRFSYQIGLDLDALSPVMMNLWNRATKAKFSCEPLIAAQAQLKKNNPSIMGMVTGMAQGALGVGLELQDLQLSDTTQAQPIPNMKKLSFMATLSAKQPEQLWALAKASFPMLNNVDLPEQGKSVPLPFPLPPGVPGQLELGHYGNHIALFSGDQAKALTGKLATVPLNANGLMHIGLDYSLVADLVGVTIKRELAGEAVNAPVTPPGGVAPDRLHELQQAQLIMGKLRGLKFASDMDIDAAGLALRSSVIYQASSKP